MVRKLPGQMPSAGLVRGHGGGLISLAADELSLGFVLLQSDASADATAARNVVEGNAASLGGAALPVDENSLKLSGSILPTTAMRSAKHRLWLRWLDCRQTMDHPLHS